MAITSSSIFDEVRVACSCQHLRISGVTPLLRGRGIPDNYGLVASTTDAGELVEMGILRDAIQDGKCAARVGVLNAAMTSAILVISLQDNYNIEVGDILVIDEEMMKVTGFTQMGVAQVTRGFGGTTAAAHTANTDVYIRVVFRYYDQNLPRADRSFPYEDLPELHSIIHSLHTLMPDNRHKVIPTHILTGDVEEDSDTERPTIKYKADIQTENRIPAGANYDAALDLWRVQVIGDSLNFRLPIDPALGIVQDDLGSSYDNPVNDLPGVKIMDAFLKSLTTDTIDADFAFIIDGAFANRNYEWEQASGSTVEFQTTAGFLITHYNADDVLTGVSFNCAVQSGGATPDEDLLQEYLDTQTVSTPVNGLALEPTSAGGRASYLRGERLYLDSVNEFLRRRNGHLEDVYLDEQGNMRHTPVGFGRGVDIADISVATGDTYKRIPVGPHANVVYLSSGATADEDVQLVKASEFVGARNNDRPLSFHNESDTYKLKLRDLDGNIFYTVHPHEIASFLMRQKDTGTGEFTSVSVPARHIVYSMEYDQPDESNDLDAVDSWKRLDTVEGVSPNIVNGNAYVLPQPAQTLFDFFHDDFFEIYTAAFADDLAIFSQTMETDIAKKGAIKIIGQSTGFIQIDVNLDIRLHSSWTGNINNPEMRVFRYSEGDTEGEGTVEELVSQNSNNMWTAGEDYNHKLVHRGRIEEGDILIPNVWWADGWTFSNLAHIQGRRMTVEVTVEPEIIVELAA